jgi:hypothetical protein
LGELVKGQSRAWLAGALSHLDFLIRVMLNDAGSQGIMYVYLEYLL